MNRPDGEHFEVLSCSDSPGGEGDRLSPRGRPWIGIHFECCAVYARVYRDPESPQYNASCPKCGCGICIRVGPEGVNGRIFRATPV
jgi:hypothetical protein